MTLVRAASNAELAAVVKRPEDRTFLALVSTPPPTSGLRSLPLSGTSTSLNEGTVPNNRLVILPNQPIVEAKTIVSFRGSPEKLRIRKHPLNRRITPTQPSLPLVR